jgi:agmatine deiminase
VGVEMKQVRFFRIPTNRVWTRDSGPIFVVKQARGKRERLLTDWRFNAWAKYPDWQLDDKVPRGIARALRAPRVEPVAGERRQRMVLEGGSIDVNGSGMMLTTEECLLSDVQERNPGLTRGDIERAFADYLGIRKTIWLKNGIAGDDTHGHVDDLARFTDERTIVIASEPDRSDPNFQPLAENLRILKRATDQHGRKFRIVTLPMPQPVYFAGQRLPASYANFYIANGTVLVPTYNDPADRVALNTLQRLFPDRQVNGIHSVDLIWGLGALHCMTQQQPAA